MSIHLSVLLALREQKQGRRHDKLTLPLIERLVKLFKTHRAAIDFDASFVYGFVPALKDGVIVIDE
jgi:hypothetical protein